MIKRFKEISSNDVATCGGKGASLGELMRAGLPFSNGFVLTTEAYGKDSKHWEDKLIKAFNNLDTKYVAVRSSGTKEDGDFDSFAGQFETFLFVDKENLVEKIKECHQSINSPRIKAYCESKGIDRNEIQVAVVVQKMVNSEVAGVLFTMNPVNSNENEVVIESGWGQGEAVVSGMITPDNYIVDKKSNKIKSKNIGKQTEKLVINKEHGGVEKELVGGEKQKQQKLSDKFILELGGVAKKIEQHYKKPMDIEWAVEGDELYILQSRPITIKGNFKVSKEAKEFVEQLIAGKEAGDLRKQILKRDICVLVRSLIFEGQMTETFNKSLGKDIPPVADVSISSELFTLKQSAKNVYEAINSLVEDGGYKTLKIISKTCQESAVELISYLSKDLELTVSNLKKIKSLYKKLTSYLLIVVFSEKYLEEQVKKLIIEKTGSENDELFKSLVYVKEYNATTQEVKDLLKIAKEIKENNLSLDNQEVEKKLKDHHEKYKWIGNRWQLEGDWQLDDVIERLQGYLEEDIEKQLKNFDFIREEANRETEEFINQYNLSQNEIDLIKLVKKFVYLRSFRTESISHANSLLGRFLQNMGDTYGIAWENFKLFTIDELIEVLDSGEIDNNLLENRKNNKNISVQYNDKIYIFNGREASYLLSKDIFPLDKGRNKEKVDSISGNKAQGGFVKGVVKVVHSTKDLDKVKKGDILVAVMTFPHFISAMERAEAFVTDEGGILCHAAIVSREMDKPCVIGTKKATKLLKDGDFVEVDADNGLVRVLSK